MLGDLLKGLPLVKGLPLDAVRARLAAPVLSLVRGTGAPTIDFSAPLGDPGLLGPSTVAWRVHADFSAMMVGGLSALFLQTLHPLAMAGVYDHSGFRDDPFGRLRRTATFIAATTYGATAVAEAQLERVRRIHERIVGTAPDGRRYAASDPELLTWIHTAEVASFLAAHLRYLDDSLTAAEQDRYYAETALFAERLGARQVPRSVGEVRAYFARVRPELAYGLQARETVEFLRQLPAPHPVAEPAQRLFFAAAIDLLPGFARELMGLRQGALETPAVVRPAFRKLAQGMRWILRGDSAEQRARRRIAPPA